MLSLFGIKCIPLLELSLVGASISTMSLTWKKTSCHVIELGERQKKFESCLEIDLQDRQKLLFQYDKEFYAPYSETASNFISRTSQHVMSELKVLMLNRAKGRLSIDKC